MLYKLFFITQLVYVIGHVQDKNNFTVTAQVCLPHFQINNGEIYVSANRTFWYSKTHKFMSWMHTLKWLGKRKPSLNTYLRTTYRCVSAPGKWSWSGLCWRCCFGHDRWWPLSEICM